MEKGNQIRGWYKTVVIAIELLLALVILGGVILFGLHSTQTLSAMDWRATETFYELIYRVLPLVIAVELGRTLVTHDLRAILELLAFVVARKMLKPDLTVLDIILSVIAFVALLAANHYWLTPTARQASSDRAP